MSEKIISIRFLSFKGFSNKRFAFAQMGISLVNPWKYTGLLFSKHLGVGAGNGFSKYITRPAFQLGIDDITINKRCTPDLSLLADPTTGFVVCYASRYYIYGGTSLATPLCAGMIAIANQIRKSPLTTNITYTKGEIHNYLYQIIYKNKTIYTNVNSYAGNFYDVTIGKNGIYSANLGYDVASGLGSLNANIICNSLANA